MRRYLEDGSSGSAYSATDSSMTQVRHSQFKDAGNGPKASVAALFEQGTSCLSYKLINQGYKSQIVANPKSAMVR